MTYLTLFYEFFKTGLFAVGGGMATLPFLYDMVKYGWYSMPELMDMIAVSESTPGPIGVNMATYAGFRAGGLLGGVTSTLSLVLPSIIIVILVYKILERFKENPIVQNCFYSLRPAVAGLIVVAIWELFRLTILQPQLSLSLTGIFQWKSLLLFLLLSVCVFRFKKIHPIVFILTGALCGIVFSM